MSKTIEVKPILTKKGEPSVRIAGRTIDVDFRIVSELNYQLMLEAENELIESIESLVGDIYAEGINNVSAISMSLKKAKETVLKHKE